MRDEDVIDNQKLIEEYSKKFDLFKKFGCDRYLFEYGLCVKPEYRGRGIATEILKARVPQMKLLGIKVSLTAFSAIESQAAAENAGFKVIHEVTYTELKKSHPRYDLSKSNAKSLKYMTLEVKA